MKRTAALSASPGNGRIKIDCCLLRADERSLAQNVRAGLTSPVKQLPPKHFYDARGSELFEAICALPEYYLTRSEREILRERAAEIVSVTGARELVELGSGAPDKARVLLDEMQRDGASGRYVPVDVSEQALRDAAQQLADAYPRLLIHGVVADFERQLDRIPPADGLPRVVALLGSTIGNFAPAARRALLRDLAALLRSGDQLLVGVDLVKDQAVLEAAYNDAQGITAEFNRNVLYVINRELDADFQPDAFEHVAFFDPEHEWIEMRLRAQRDMTVHIAKLGLEVTFARDEDLRTEISAKFTPARLSTDLAAAGLAVERWFTDRGEHFALVLARRPG